MSIIYLKDLIRLMNPKNNIWKSKEEFKEQVYIFADKLEIEIKGLYIRPMKNKWASCSTDGNLNFNKELLNMSKDIGKYVIFHELLHFFIPNHGKLWKSLMLAHLGDYKFVEKQLSNYENLSPNSARLVRKK